MLNKVGNIETLRGLAILLVVIGHVIGSTPEGGMKIDFPSPWRYLYLWIDYIQMPLFTAIAGWVYALKPISANSSIKQFVQKKIYRLLIPMAVAATCYFLVQYIIPGTNQKGNLTDIWKIYIFPYTLYWYLPSLFIMFMIIALIDLQKWANRIYGWSMCVFIAYLVMLLNKEILPTYIPNIFSFKGAINMFPYFIIGLGINRFYNDLFTVKLMYISTFFALIGIILLQFKWFYPHVLNPIYENIQSIGLIASLLLLLHQKHTYRPFTWLGNYAYIIYLYHGFGTSGGRIILKSLGIHSEILIFIFATFIALFLPIAIEKYGKKSKKIQFLLLGIKSSKK